MCSTDSTALGCKAGAIDDCRHCGFVDATADYTGVLCPYNNNKGLPPVHDYTVALDIKSLDGSADGLLTTWGHNSTYDAIPGVTKPDQVVTIESETGATSPEYRSANTASLLYGYIKLYDKNLIKATTTIGFSKVDGFTFIGLLNIGDYKNKRYVFKITDAANSVSLYIDTESDRLITGLIDFRVKSDGSVAATPDDSFAVAIFDKAFVRNSWEVVALRVVTKSDKTYLQILRNNVLQGEIDASNIAADKINLTSLTIGGTSSVLSDGVVDTHNLIDMYFYPRSLSDDELTSMYKYLDVYRQEANKYIRSV
jgi:hypothetical protein